MTWRRSPLLSTSVRIGIPALHRSRFRGQWLQVELMFGVERRQSPRPKFFSPNLLIGCPTALFGGTPSFANSICRAPESVRS